MSLPSIRRRGPDGRVHASASAYCESWRRELAPLVELTGWAIHSFGHECAKLVSPDYQHTQVIDLAFAEALRGKLPKTLPADASARK
jgi:hypothetical protein